jgi:microcystin-dependent protein
MSATNLGLSFLNAVATAYGVTINDTKFYTAAQTLVPSGSISMFGGAAAPTGWLLCNGALVSRTTYASLFTAIGTTFGAGDGSTTFGLPDLRGIFPRGAGTNGTLTNAAGTAFAATLGSYVNDQMQGHGHTPTINGAAIYSAATSGSGANNVNNTNGNNTGGNQWLMTTPNLNTGSGTPRAGGETNPANLGVTFIIAT